MQGVVGGGQPVALLRRRSGPPAKERERESVIDERHYADRGRRASEEAASPLDTRYDKSGGRTGGVKSTPFPARLVKQSRMWSICGFVRASSLESSAHSLSHPASQPQMSRHVRGQESPLHLLLDRCRHGTSSSALRSPQCVTECIAHANSEAHPSRPIPCRPEQCVFAQCKWRGPTE